MLMRKASQNTPLTPETVIHKRREYFMTKQSLFDLLLKLLLMFIFGWVMLTFFFGIGVVNGEDMYPRMRDGDVTIYYRMEKNINIGDIVTFKAEGKQRYARVVAREGDKVDMTEEGQFVVNGSVQQEEIFFATNPADNAMSYPRTIEPGKLFVLGDNRTQAEDSRNFGSIDKNDIDGKVISLLRRRGL